MGVRGYGDKLEPEPESEPGIKIFSQTGSTGFTGWEKLMIGDW